MSAAEYGSHKPLLTAVLEHFKPRTVLETGSGLHSTPLFLAHPIERLVSYENNAEWAMRTRTEDPRHELRWVEGNIVDHLPPLYGFDLIFIDDDPVGAREDTITYVMSQAPPLVVIHDIDYPPFFSRLKGRTAYIDSRQRPHTAVLSPATTKEFAAWLESQ